MFNITANFNAKDVTDFIQAETEAWFTSLLNPFRITGKEMVDKARAQTKTAGGFGNITWRLRSSIGYILIYNGQVVETYFPPLQEGAEGLATGEDYAREIATLIDIYEGVQLVLVAGMEYAVLVERQGKDVISHVVGDNIGAALTSLLR
jgi:hypothetical protein